MPAKPRLQPKKDDIFSPRLKGLAAWGKYDEPPTEYTLDGSELKII